MLHHPRHRPGGWGAQPKIYHIINKGNQLPGRNVRLGEVFAWAKCSPGRNVRLGREHCSPKRLTDRGAAHPAPLALLPTLECYNIYQEGSSCPYVGSNPTYRTHHVLKCSPGRNVRLGEMFAWAKCSPGRKVHKI